MNDLPLFKGYAESIQGVKPPPMPLKRMGKLAWRTWPYMRPLLLHLIVLISLSGIAIVPVFAGFLMGTDLFDNKVLIGEKLQPFQATVLFVGDEYVTKDPVKLGLAEADSSELQEGKADSVENDAQATEALLTTEQRRTVRNRLLMWGVAAGVFGGILGLAIYYYYVWIWQNVNQNLRVAMVERAESLSLKYHNNARVGDAIFRVYQDSAMIVNLVQSGIIDPLMSIYTLLFTLAIVAAFDPWFAFMLVAGGVPLTVLAFYATPRIRKRALANRVANSDLVSRTQECFTALKVVKANGAETSVLDDFHEDSHKALNAAYFLRLDMTIVTLIVASVGGLLLIAAELIMAHWVVENRATWLGALTAAWIGFAIWNYGAFNSSRDRVMEVSWGVRDIFRIWMLIQDLFIALGRAFELLDTESDIVDSENPMPMPSPIDTVAWHNVHFSYTEHNQVLRGIDLQAQKGTITAITGISGAGKSTLMSSLLRLFDPDIGTVSINGVDLREFAIDKLRSQVAIALQKNVLFADTISNNITFGATGKNRSEIAEAARIADAEDFINDLPDGFDTELGERGSKLSSGQRQRLSIARALVRDTPILILDEPTASLDAQTEVKVLDNLHEWGRERVIFLITHRLSTIRRADHIVFLDEGRVVEQGTHEEMMALPRGRYRALVQSESLETPESAPSPL